MGRINAISTSKIKKIIAIKKNRIEKGSREEEKGLKPHSNGESFSRSIFFFFDKIVEIFIIIKEIKSKQNEVNNKLIIIYIKIF